MDYGHNQVSAPLFAMSSATLVAEDSSSLFNGCMATVDEIRRARLMDLITEAGSMSALAKLLGHSSTAQLSQWKAGSPDSKTGKPRVISNESARRLENATGKTHGWMDQPSAADVEHSAIEPGAEFVPVARVMLKVSAGVTGFSVEHLHGNGPPIFFRADWLAAKGYRAERLYALRVTGDSMEPNLWEGDLIVINSADAQPRDGEVFVANYEGEVVIKRLMRDAGEWWLTSDNARHKPKRCDEHAELLGRVIYKQSERI